LERGLAFFFVDFDAAMGDLRGRDARATAVSTGAASFIDAAELD
jgi:hypothetical protein